MFKIGDFARINKVTIKALRYYDSLGLLKPDRIDDFTGYRFYSMEQIPRLNKILALKETGFSLEEVAWVLRANLSAPDLGKLLAKKRQELAEHIREEQSKLERIDFLMKMNEKEDSIVNYDVVIKNVEAVKVASLRDMIPSYEKQGHLWEELVDYINKHGVKFSSPCMVRYFNEGYKEDAVDVEVIEPIIGDLPESDRIKVKLLPEEEMACVVHVGPFNGLSIAYGVIEKYIEENAYEVTAPTRELYLKGEWATDDPAEYITELQFPVRKKNR